VSPGNLVEVKNRLGHEKIETTINICGHMVADRDKDLAAALDEYAARPVANVVQALPVASDRA
jgi:hypothetical protein